MHIKDLFLPAVRLSVLEQKHHSIIKAVSLVRLRDDIDVRNEINSRVARFEILTVSLMVDEVLNGLLALGCWMSVDSAQQL